MLTTQPAAHWVGEALWCVEVLFPRRPGGAASLPSSGSPTAWSRPVFLSILVCQMSACIVKAMSGRTTGATFVRPTVGSSTVSGLHYTTSELWPLAGNIPTSRHCSSFDRAETLVSVQDLHPIHRGTPFSRTYSAQGRFREALVRHRRIALLRASRDPRSGPVHMYCMY